MKGTNLPLLFLAAFLAGAYTVVFVTALANTKAIPTEPCIVVPYDPSERP